MNRLLVGCSYLALPALALLFMGCSGEARDEAHEGAQDEAQNGAQEGAQEGAQNGTSSPAVRALRAAFAERAPEVLQQEHAFKRSERGFTLKDPGAEGTWRSIEAELPREGQGQVRFKLPTGLEVRVREIGAEGAGELAEQAVVYPREGGRSYWAAAAGGYEEWLHLRASAVNSATAVAVWHVEGATLRQAEEAVEIVDGDGATQMRVTAPTAYGAGGRPVKARLTGGDGRIELFVEADGEEVLVDPLWASGASMAAARYAHGAAVLADGKVLVVGGYGTNAGGTYYSSSVEVYNPLTNSWSATASMSSTRRTPGMALLDNNKVLVAGGWGSNPSSAELYDPAAGTWSSAGTMSVGRESPTVTLLTDGSGRVLVAGGSDQQSAQLYNPATNTWTSAGSMATGRAFHHAVRLNSGEVLVVGGSLGTIPQASAELYNPTTNTWSSAGAMSVARVNHTATLLNDGRVLVAAGYSNSALSTAELYNPATNTWSPAASMAVARELHTATRLQNGRVLVTGGSKGGPQASVEQYNPATNTWSSAGALATARYFATASLLQNGKVLVAGGVTGSPITLLPSTELYLLPLNATCATNSDCQSGFCVDGLCCSTSCGGGVSTDCQACNVPGSEGACSTSSSGSVCRPAAGACDAAEACNGSSTSCPADGFTSGTTCRASAGACDVAESCPGNGPACPVDSFQPAATTCRGSAGACDVIETCTGSGPACPADAFLPPVTTCRGSAGLCDVTESCTGASASCPADGFRPAGTQCLNGPGVCSAAKACTGAGAACP